ncbi:hypothetical protein [Empedobacter brevis]|uniref:hypothetical protein n=1 Tax=Empedobacter brevis TaxID=247 RepID=UPI002FE02496
MSTNASQTLFRFTSLRNPELTTTKDNLGFVARPNEISGFFDQLLQQKTDQNQTKLAFLISHVQEFKSQTAYLESEDDLKNLVDLEMFDSILLEGFNEKPENNRPSIDVSLTPEILIVLWDNLIYQTLTEERFYLKEKIFEILKKRHYILISLGAGEITNEVELEEIKKQAEKARQAKIVLPEVLFVESESVKKQLGRRRISNLSVSELQELKQKAEKQKIVTEAKAKKEKLLILRSELSKAQTIYQKNYAKALKLEQNTYEESIRTEKEDYELRLLQAEANLEANATEAQRKLALASVAKPDYKTFNFVFREELDTTFLEEKLSSDSLTALDHVVSKNGINIDLEENQQAERPAGAINFDQDEYESFHDVLKAVEEKIALQDQLIVANTEVEKQQFLNVGGVFLPVSNTGINLKLPEYNLCTKRKNDTGIYDIDFSFQVPDQSFVIKNVSYVIEDEIKAFTHYGESFNVEKVGNKIKLTNLVTDGDNNLEVFPTTDITFNIKINFTNGLVYDFVKIPIVYDGCTKKDSPSEGSFIPSGFGVRRLGIADYLKVEQSTHAYVPGEVAHIENIMAREYREKSTRRLSRTEDTTTLSSETEREQLTDTTTATRFEMQTEIAKMMSETTDVATYANGKKWGIEMGASFANNRSKEESFRAATTQAQDITARALDRIVSKVKEERVRKVVEEFEENNMHGFDNRKGNQHVVGVYRWVDKIMKNQIFNYGKRMMFEFMIPQPSKIHRLAMTNMNPTEVIEKPVDPRIYDKDSKFNLTDYSKIDSNTLKFWGSYYNVELPNYTDEIYIGKAISFTSGESGNGNDDWDEVFAKDDFIEIPEGYTTTHTKIKMYSPAEPNKGKGVIVGNHFFMDSVEKLQAISNYEGQIPISMSQVGYHAGSVNIEVKCVLTEYGRRLLFNKIITAYEEALAAYDRKVQDAEETASNIKETNANFYRQIESDVLKHNCMAYLVDPTALGTDLILNGDHLNDIQVKLNKNLDDYTSLAKFMEQAFEWDIMSYNFYPYFWGAKKDWGELYQSESIDPLFRSFLQSGMARVVVTVKPGFEDAVQFYMSTGKIWNGGEVPVIGDPLYLSLVDEMREPTGEKVGKFWLTRIPTSLNILQAQSIGLEVSEALPFTPENAVDCENPEMLVDAGKFPFKNENALLNGGESSIEIEEVISGDWTDTTSVD